MTATVVDSAADSLDNALGATLTLTLASTPDAGDVLLLAVSWVDTGFGGPTYGYDLPDGWRRLIGGASITHPPSGSTHVGGWIGDVFVREADGTETDVDLATAPSTGSILAGCVRLADVLCSTGWNDSAHTEPDTSEIDLSFFSLTVDIDGLGLTWVFKAGNSEPTPDAPWVSEYATSTVTFDAAQMLYTTPLAAGTTSGPDTGITGFRWASIMLGVIELDDHLATAVVQPAAKPVRTPIGAGTAFRREPAERRALAKNPPDPPERLLPGVPWQPKPGGYRPPA